MTRKHFRAMAARIAELPNARDRYNMACIFAELAASLNPRFDRAKFFDAARANCRGETHAETLQRVDAQLAMKE